MNYWIITLWDKERIRVKPENVDFVKGKLTKGEGHIITASRTIAVKDIKSFEESDIPVAKAQLESGELEASSAQAFKEPIFNEDGSVQVRAVKKYVQRRKWESYYAPHGTYKMLGEDDNKVLVGFYASTDQIDLNKVEYCTPEEESRLR